MSISIFFSALMILATAPFLTHQMFNESYSRQLTQIAIDNTAIKLAQKDLATLNFIENSNRLISGLEKIHHPIHLVVNSGIASAQLLVQDKALETSIHEIHSNTFLIANWKWSQSFLSAIGELARLRVALVDKKRATKLPILSKRCSLCFKENFWAIKPRQTDSWLKVVKDSWSPSIWVRLYRKSTNPQAHWTYQLKDG